MSFMLFFDLRKSTLRFSTGNPGTFLFIEASLLWKGCSREYPYEKYSIKLDEEEINDGEQINETLEIPIDNPTGAAEMIISFGVIEAQNDWWWAIDNIKLISTAFDVEPRDKLAVKWAEIKALQ